MGSLGLSMPGRSNESSSYGEAPAWNAESAPPVAQQAVPATLAVPVSDEPLQNEQLPNGFMGGMVAPNQYPQPTPPSRAGPNPQHYGYPQGSAPPPGHPVPSSIPEQRIVYVPYAAPPPIYVERLGKALPRPPVVRRVLGDANIYEYPEMPMRTYTTRGPRDFLAPNPPSIGY